jgi:iron-sulfur cluster assembly protein
MDIALTDTKTTEVTLTEMAAEKLGGILDQKGLRETHALRVFVKGDGDGQPAFGMAIEPDPGEADETIEAFGVKVVVDEESLPWVIGSEIDFIDSLERTGFTIRNPNMGGGCGGGGACACGGGGAQAGACACGGAGAGACACGAEEATAGATETAGHAH